MYVSPLQFMYMCSQYFTGRNIWSDEVTAHYRSMLFCVISMSALRKHIMLLLALVLPAFILHNVCNFEF